MLSSSLRRLAADHASLMRQKLPPYWLFPTSHENITSDDLTRLNLLLVGPEGTPYAEGLWAMFFKFPTDYPNTPPKAYFKTSIWHPNVEESSGSICIDTLKRDWKVDLTIRDILVTLSCLLIQPNPDSALNSSAGHLIQTDYAAYERQARLMTSIHAAIPRELREAAAEAKSRGEDGRKKAPQTPKRKTDPTRKRATDIFDEEDGSYAANKRRRASHEARQGTSAAEAVQAQRNAGEHDPPLEADGGEIPASTLAFSDVADENRTELGSKPGTAHGKLNGRHHRDLSAGPRGSGWGGPDDKLQQKLGPSGPIGVSVRLGKPLIASSTWAQDARSNDAIQGHVKISLARSNSESSSTNPQMPPKPPQGRAARPRVGLRRL